MEENLGQALINSLMYSNIPDTWIDARSSGSGNVTSPENIAIFMNAMADPYNLYVKRPDTTPTSAINFDYPSVGVNYNPNPFPLKQYILTSNKESPKYSSLNINDDFAPDIGSYMVHESTHGNDPRLNPERPFSYPNMGYITRFGMPSWMLAREAPALAAEEQYNRSR